MNFARKQLIGGLNFYIMLLFSGSMFVTCSQMLFIVRCGQFEEKALITLFSIIVAK